MILLLNLSQLPSSFTHTVVSYLITQQIVVWLEVHRFTLSTSHLLIKDMIGPLYFIITLVSHLYCFCIVYYASILVAEKLLVIHTLTQFRITSLPCFNNSVNMYFPIPMRLYFIKMDVSRTHYLPVHLFIFLYLIFFNFFFLFNQMKKIKK